MSNIELTQTNVREGREESLFCGYDQLTEAYDFAR